MRANDVATKLASLPLTADECGGTIVWSESVRPDPLWRQASRVAVGLVLVATVALKLQAPTAETAGFTPEVRWLGLATEAVVGLWLVSGFAARGGWLAGLALFTLLAGVSGYHAATGQADCGCFGRVKVSPWASLLVDLACLAALLVGRPPMGRTMVAVYCGLVAVGAILLVGAEGRVGEAWLARLRGEAVQLVPATADAGTAAGGEVRVVRVTVVNHSDGDVRLLGGSVSCNCMATEGLPVTVPPFGRVEVGVKVKFGGSPGRFAHGFELYTDSQDKPRVPGRLVGTVVESP